MRNDKQNIIVDYIPRKLDISTTNIINKIILKIETMGL